MQHGPEAGERLVQEVAAQHERLERALGADAGQEKSSEQEHARRHGEDRFASGRGEQQAADRGSDEEADALDRRQDEVRRSQLLGRAREQRQQRRLRRPEGRLQQTH